MSYLRRNGKTTIGPRGRSAMGDIFCVEGDCRAGELLVNQMITFFDAVGPRMTFSTNPVEFKQNILDAAARATPKQNEFWRKFGSAYSEIVNPYFEAEAGIGRQIPFTIRCCTIKELGRKAQILTQQAHDFLGTQAPAPTHVQDPFDPSSGLFGNAVGGIFSIIKWGLVIGIGVFAYNAINKKGSAT